MPQTRLGIDQVGESQYYRQTASYTAVLSDANKDIEMNVGSANNFTVPQNSSVTYVGDTCFDATYYDGATKIHYVYI